MKALTLALFALLLASCAAYAQPSNAFFAASAASNASGPSNLSTPAATPPNQSVVNVGIYVLNVGKFDVSSGAYTIDFYLDMQCDKACDPGGFEFMNGRADHVETLIDTQTEKFYRIQASLSDNIDLKAYPFDSHRLPIIIEDQHNAKGSLVYALNQNDSGVDPAVTLVGWGLTGWNGTVEDHYYAPYDETYSRLTFNIGIQRIFLASVLKTFLPVVFIVIVGLLALLIEEPGNLWTRIGINTSALIASVMFHLNVTSSIPPVGYLTFADKFMMVTYISLVLSLLSSILMMMHGKAGEEALVKKIYLWSLYLIPLLTVLGYALLFVIY